MIKTIFRAVTRTTPACICIHRFTRDDQRVRVLAVDGGYWIEIKARDGGLTWKTTGLLRCNAASHADVMREAAAYLAKLYPAATTA